MFFWYNTLVHKAISNWAFGLNIIFFRGHVKVSRKGTLLIKYSRAKRNSEFNKKGKEETVKSRIENILIAC